MPLQAKRPYVPFAVIAHHPVGVELRGRVGAGGEIAIVQADAGLRVVRILVQMLDPLRMERTGPPDQPVDRVALREQQLGQVSRLGR